MYRDWATADVFLLLRERGLTERRVAVTDVTSTIDLREANANAPPRPGENGIVDAIVRALGTRNNCCVEFGAYDLTDNATVYPLWANQGWRALLIEGDPSRARIIGRQLDSFPDKEAVQRVRLV